MAWRNELRSMVYMPSYFLSELWNSKYNGARRYVWPIVAVSICAVIGVGSFFGYRWYVVSREQRVQLLVAESLQEYYRVTKSDNRDELARFEQLLADRYHEYGFRTMGLIFLILQADIQLKQEKYQDAIETLNKVSVALPHTSPLAELVNIKRALVQLDVSDDAIHQIGLQELDRLAHDKSNAYRDMALFYMGRYYWAHDKLDVAKKVWQELVDDPLYAQAFGSPWVREAHEALSRYVE